MRGRIVCIGLLLATAVAGNATAGMSKGGSVFAVQLTSDQGSFVQPEAQSGYIQSLTHSEQGVQAQYWYMWSEDYAMTASAGIGFARESDSPGSNSLPGDPTFKDSYSSWQVRVGGDRVGKVTDRFHLYAGPGVQFWGGKVTFKSDDTTVEESASATRIGVDGRVGVLLNWGQGFGMAGQIGHLWGYSSATDAGAKAKFTPSTATAGMGIFFIF